MTTTEYLDEPETLPQEIIDWQPTHHEPATAGARAATTALGAVAVGALAAGAVAIGALAIGRLFIGSARIRRLEIDELIIRRFKRPD